MAKKMGAAKFKESCLSILDKVDKEGLIITKNGKPVAKLIPIEQDKMSFVGKFKDQIEVHGDIFSTGVQWNAES